MAKVAGYKTVRTVDGTTIGFSRSSDFARQAEKLDTTDFNSSGDMESIPGLRSAGPVTIDGLWVPTASSYQALDTAYQAGTNVTYREVDGNGYGWEYTAWVQNISRGSDQGDAVTVSITLELTGAATAITPSS